MTDNKIFVGNIPHFINEELLKKRFEEHGSIRDLYYFPDILGSDRGWATITYGCKDEAATAVAIEDGVEDPFPGAERAMHVKFFNQPLSQREGTVFDLRPREQKVLTPWTEVTSEEDGGATYYVNELTEETTWTRPKELDQVVMNPSGANVAVGNADMVDVQEGLVASVVGSHENGPLGCNLVIYGDFKGITDQQLHDRFALFGRLVGCKVEKAEEQGFASVAYSTQAETADCARALHLQDVFFNGTKINITVKKSEEQYNTEAKRIIDEALLNSVP